MGINASLYTISPVQRIVTMQSLDGAGAMRIFTYLLYLIPFSTWLLANYIYMFKIRSA